MDFGSSIANGLDKSANKEHHTHPFWTFEPWDIVQRPEWMLRKAAEDSVNLYDPQFVEVFGRDPKEFQTGYFMSLKQVRFLIAGSQIGKSICPLMEMLIMISGQLPYAFRYEKGEDTGVKRAITPENIHRYGRIDTSTHKVIDYRTNVPQAKDWNEWDCGNIMGAGIYPQEKIPEAGSQIWIGTIAESIKKYWWPKLTHPEKRVLPIEFVNTALGNNGVNASDKIVHCMRGITIFIMSFEQGHTKFESEKCCLYIGDEETTTEEIYASALLHAKYVAMAMTPLKGISWSKRLVYDLDYDADRFHATQYDSPYVSREKVDKDRVGLSIWIRQARIWGLYAEQTGVPYFDRAKLNIWAQRYQMHREWVSFAPRKEWYKMKGDRRISPLPGLVDVDIHMTPEQDNNDTTSWRMYEDRKAGEGYVLAADPAEGAEDPEDCGDVSAAIIVRKDTMNDLRPYIVCTLRSTLPTIAFARVCAYAMRYYNNALLAAESGIGAENKAFELEVEDWPYWYMCTVTRDATGSPRQKRGFVMKTKQREAIFKEIEAYLAEYDVEDYPNIPDVPLLEEMAAAVVGKNARCDHTKKGSLDSTVCFGILLHVFNHDSDQILCNLVEKKKNPKRNIRVPPRKGFDCGMKHFGMKE